MALAFTSVLSVIVFQEEYSPQTLEKLLLSSLAYIAGNIWFRFLTNWMRFLYDEIHTANERAICLDTWFYFYDL